MNNFSKIHLLILLSLLLLLGSCGKSSYSTFSKPDEKYRSAREIAELKKKERLERREARKAGTGGKELKEIHISGKNKKTSRSMAGNKATSREIQTVIATARSYRGTPYKFGGTTRVGMDCSGLLCTSFQAIDVQLPRTSSQQSEFGVPVSPRQLQPGDLLFFSSSQSVHNITHVGLVTEVKDENEVWFIHSSTSLGVTENNLYSPYYQRTFVKAVRPAI